MPTIFAKLSSGTTQSIEIDSLQIDVAALKEVLAEKVSIEVGFQRVVFRGKVLKDTDKLSSVGVDEGSTLHVVKSQTKAAESAPAQAVSTEPVVPVVPTAEVNPAANPYAALFGTGAGTGSPTQNWGATGFGSGWTPSPNDAMGMMQNPMVMQMVQMMMQDPQMLQTVMASNPMLRNMPPEVVQQSLQMMNNPAMMQQMMQMMNNTGSNLGGRPPPQQQQGPSPFFVPPPPGNPREIYASQLEQLRAMGFPNEQANIAALQQSQGNIEFAIERLLNA